MASDDVVDPVDRDELTSPWFVDRLRSLFSRVTNQGLGPFVCFAVALAAAAVLCRLFLFYNSQDRAYLSDLMGTQMPPMLDVNRGAVLTVVLQAIKDPGLSASLYCGERNVGDCGAAQRIINRTNSLIQWKDTVSPDAAHVQMPAQDLNDTAATTLNGLPEASRRLRAVFELAQHDASQLGSATRDTCGDFAKAIERGVWYDFAQPLCEATSEASVQIVPQPIADERIAQAMPPPAGDNSAEPSSPAPNTAPPSDGSSITLHNYRVLRARFDGRLFSLAAQSVSNELTAKPYTTLDQPTSAGCPKCENNNSAGSETPSSPTLAAAYFLSVDSVLQYWSRTGAASVSAFPTYRLWAARAYVDDLIRDLPASKRSATGPYIDFAGNGIVQTECSLVETSRDERRAKGFPVDRAPSRARSGPLYVGAVCFDFVLTEKKLDQLVDVLNRSPIAQAAVIAFNAAGSDAWTPEVIYGPHELLRGAGEKWVQTIPSTWPTDSTSQRTIAALEGSDALLYFVPLGARSDGRKSGLLLEIDGVAPWGSRPWVSILAIVALVVALLAYRSGTGSSKEIARRENDLGNLRSLQTGVVRTDGEDKITGANDRAEELLGVGLPAFGLEQPAVPFWTIFEEDSILRWKGGHAPSRPLTTASLEPMTAGTIRRQRASGQYSEYFVRLRDRQEVLKVPTGADRALLERPVHALAKSVWLCVKAGPVFRPTDPVSSSIVLRLGAHSAVDLLGTFGIVERVSDLDIIEQLESRRLEVAAARANLQATATI